MNNFSIEIPWWSGMLMVAFIIALFCALAYYMYEAFLKFLIVWKHGYPKHATPEQIEKQVKVIMEKAMTDKMVDILTNATIEKEVSHG
jgi:hypothetical protein